MVEGDRKKEGQGKQFMNARGGCHLNEEHCNIK